MKFSPASRKASHTFLASSLAEPQPHALPKVMVPSAASEARSPLLPRSRYRIEISFFVQKKSLVLERAGGTSRIRQYTCKTRQHGEKQNVEDWPLSSFRRATVKSSRSEHSDNRGN